MLKRAAAVAALMLAGCGQNHMAGLSEAQQARCQWEARRATLYQGGILGALQNVEMQQMCARAAQLESREAIMARLQLHESQRGTPIVRSRVAGMAEACGMSAEALAPLRQKSEIDPGEWSRGRTLGAQATPAECALARNSVMAYLAQ